MASKLHQNAILTGCIDSFCLACESHLRSEQDAVSHIEKPVHIKNLKSAPYLIKFAYDHVRKIKKGYYCEFCNVLLPTAARVGHHVAEQTHNDSKGSQLIKRFGNNVIVGDNILISEQAWNGLIMDTCAICNMEFRNLKLHITEQKHVLNLIQKKVEFGEGTTVYRKIDESSFHCLICNTICALNTVTTHSKEKDHDTHVHKCQELYHSDVKNNAENQSKINDLESGKMKDQDINGLGDDGNKDQDKNGFKDGKNKDQDKNGFEGGKNKHQDKNGLENGTNKNKDEKKGENKDHNKNGFEKEKGNSLKNKKNESNHDELKESIPANNIHNVLKKSKQIPITINGTGPKSDGNNNDIKINQLNKTKRSVDNSTSTQNEEKPACTPTENRKACLVHEAKKTKNTEIKDKDKLFEHVSEFQKNGVNINFETETAFCKKCFEDVDLDIDIIKQHINQHKTNPKKEATANTVHTMNENHSRTVLNSKDNDDYASSKSTKKFEQNHNDTKNMPKKKDTQEKEEEIIKIDLRKKSGEEFEETETNNAVVNYVPKAGASTPEPPKPEAATEEPAKKEALDMNDPETFAKHHSLTFNKGNGNAFCRICNTRVPAAIRNMKEHINGMSHKTKVAKVVQLEKAAKHIPKKPTCKFVHQQSTVMNVHGVDDVILNDKHCLTRMSFYMITTQNRLRCQACEVTLRKDEVSRHVEGVFHERAMERTPVVTSLDSEFIREVRRDLYHCGYCNLIAGSWEDVQRHLQCAEHKECARDARRRLDAHLPDILAHRETQERVYMSALFQRFWPFF